MRAGYDIVYVYAGHATRRTPPFPVPPLQRPHRRIRRQPREPRAAAARDPRGHPRGGATARPRSPAGSRVDELLGDEGINARRDRGRHRHARRAARPLGLRAGQLGGRLRDLALRPRGRAGALRARPQAADHQARGRRRPLHLARHDGAADARPGCSTSSARPARRSPTRSCRARSRRGGSRTSASASAATSASPATSRCRRSAAPRTRPWARNGGAAGIPSASAAKASDAQRAGGRRRAGGLEAARALGKRGYDVSLAEATPDARRPRRARVDAAGPVGVDPRASTIASSRSASSTTSRSSAERDDRRRHHRERLQPRGDRHRRDLAAATASGAGTPSRSKSPTAQRF